MLAGEAAVPGAMAPPLPRPAVFQGNRPAAAAAAAGHGGAGVGAGGPNKRFVSQITPPSPGSGLSGPTPVSQAGFRRLVPGKGQQLTLLSIEIHADTRCPLGPCPPALSHSPCPSIAPVCAHKLAAGDTVQPSINNNSTRLHNGRLLLSISFRKESLAP